MRLMIANSVVYWLVKIANKTMVKVIGVGDAASNGIGAVSAPACWTVDKIKPSRIVTVIEVIKPALNKVCLLQCLENVIINSGKTKQFSPAYNSALKNVLGNASQC